MIMSLVASFLCGSYGSSRDPRPSPILLSPPICLSKAQLGSLCQECDRDHTWGKNIVLVFGANSDGAAIWVIATEQGGMDSREVWLTKKGLFSGLETVHLDVTPEDLIWRRRVPLYKTVWFTDDQAHAMFSRCNGSSQVNSGNTGICFVKRTSQGADFRLTKGPGLVPFGPLLCVTDAGSVEKAVAKLPPTKLNWRQILLKARR